MRKVTLKSEKKYMRVVDADEPQDPSRQQVHSSTSRLTTRSNRQLRLHAVWISHSLPYLLGSVKQLFINSGLGNSNETRPDFANGIHWIPGTAYWITQYIMCITHSICCFCLHWRSWRLLSKVCTLHKISPSDRDLMYQRNIKSMLCTRFDKITKSRREQETPLHRRYPAKTMIGTQSDEQLIKTISNPLQHTDSTKFSTEISTARDQRARTLQLLLLLSLCGN